MIYVATSWKNDGPELDGIHYYLRDHGVETFDFRDNGGDANSLEEIDPGRTLTWTKARRTLHSRKLANLDFLGLSQAAGVLLVLPAGRSAHLEAGFAVGKRIPLVITWIGNEEVGNWDVVYHWAHRYGRREIVLPWVVRMSSHGLFTPRGSPLVSGV